MDNKFTQLFKSRKFWALVISLTGIWTAVYVGSLTVPDAINASVAALAAYSVSTGIEDSSGKG
jgi:hypothetical protein